MSYCSNCGCAVNEDVKFCSNCGADINQFFAGNNNVPNAPYMDKENDFMEKTYRFIRWERKALSITGMTFLIFGIIYTSFCLLMLFISAAAEAPAVFATLFLFYSMFGTYFIAYGVVNIIARNKADKYLDGTYPYANQAFSRCGSIGMIVFNAIFNNIALIFYVINFVRIKNSTETVESIKNREIDNINDYF